MANNHFKKKIEVLRRGKIEFFLIGVFHKNHMRKDRFWYCGKSSMILSEKNWTFKEGQKMDIFQGG